jgi:hypothetical protein
MISGSGGIDMFKLFYYVSIVTYSLNAGEILGIGKTKNNTQQISI